MKSNRFETPFFVGLIILAMVLVGYVFLPYLSALVMATALAILFYPVFLWMLKKMPKWRSTAAFLTVIFAVIVILLPLSFFGVKIFEEAELLYSRIASGNQGAFLDFLDSYLKTIAPWLNIDLNKYFQQFLNALAGGLGSFFSKVADTTIKILMALFAFYYFLKDAEVLRKNVLRLSPLAKDKTEKIISKLLAMADSVIKGSLIVGVAQGFLVGLGFFLFGLTSPVLWGSVAAVTSLIPILGVSIVVIPGIISLFIAGNIPMLIGFTVWSGLIAGLADNFLRPLIMERDVHVHPLLIFFSVLGGLAVFGGTGLLLGPLALSFFLALLEIYPVILREGEEK